MKDKFEKKFEILRPELINEIKSKYSGKLEFGFGGIIVSTNQDKIPSFLESCYRHKLINDYIIDQIQLHHPFDDFRITTDKFINLLNGQLSEEPDEEEFEQLALQQLAQIENSVRRQTIAYELI